MAYGSRDLYFKPFSPDQMMPALCLIRAVVFHCTSLLLLSSLLTSPVETALGWTFSTIDVARRKALRRIFARPHCVMLRLGERRVLVRRTKSARVWSTVRMLRIKQFIERARLSR